MRFRFRESMTYTNQQKDSREKYKTAAYDKERKEGEIAQPAAGSDFLCAMHLLIMADRRRVRRSSGNS